MKKDFVTVNDVVIECPSHNGEQYVAVKPICEALGVDHTGQIRDLKADEILSSVVDIMSTTGADGKQYEMVCLPLKFVFGWLFSIKESKVKPEAKEAVRRYKMECYDALYKHFYGRHAQREESLERTVTLQRELMVLKEKPQKTGDDFERYLEVERQLRHEQTLRKSLTSQCFSEMKGLFDDLK